jgi:HEAT repeat protein
LASNQPHALVPIYFSARELNPQSLPRLHDLSASLGLGNVPPDFFSNVISENRALVLVDDLDALPPDAAKEWLKEYSAARLVATAPSAVLGLPEFSLPAWRDQDIERFAQRKFGKRTEAFLGALKASGVPRALTASPMTLALLAHAWASERPAAQSHSELHAALDIKPLPVKRAALFSAYANEILTGDDQTARMLEGVALAIQRGKPAPGEFVAKSKGFLRAGKNSTCDFIHDLWRAYFAARAARHAGDLTAIAEHLQDPGWRDVILFYAGLGDASDLIQTLIQRGDWLLAGSAIANAADARAELRDAVTKELLERAWKGEPRAAVVLGEMQSDAVVAALAARLKDPEPSVRSRAAEILGRLQMDRALEYLLPQMRDVNADTRDQVVAALGGSLSNRVIEPLLGAFRGDFRVGVVDTRMRVAAAKALGQVGSDKAVPALIVDLQIAEPEVRSVAAEALKQIDSPLMIKPLKGILASVDEETRKYVADVLAAANGKEN